jgi:hypothetical protein
LAGPPIFLSACSKGICKGLFVTGETGHGFKVRELSGGKSGVEFDYRIVAHRNGYEANRMPVAIMPVRGEMHEWPKLPVLQPGARAVAPLAAKLNRTGAVINKKK